MSDPAALLVRAVARAFADGRRVLLVGGSFEALAALAEAPVKELVIVTPFADPDAPAGETALGAPLRMRPDWRERPNSKDLVVDPTGEAPADQVLRVLKKHGVYVTSQRNAVLDALPQVTEVPTQWVHALQAADTPVHLVSSGEGYAEGPTLFLASKTDAIAPPRVLCTVPGELAPKLVDPAVLEAQADALSAVEAQLAEVEADRAAAIGAAEAIQARVTELESTLAAAEARAAEGAKASAALAELEADFDQVRAELAERRVADRRTDAVTARFESARASMTAEVAELKARLQSAAAPAADLETLVAERDAGRAAARRLADTLAVALGTLAAARMVGAPPPPVTDDETLQGWCALATEALQAEGQARDAQASRLAALETAHAALTQRARELNAAVQVLEAEAAPTHTPTLPAVAEAPGHVAALEQALASERALREAERAAYTARVAAAEAVLADQHTLHQTLARTRREAARAQLVTAAQEEAARRLQTELDLRARRVKDLEGMLQAHGHMHDLLNTALTAAETARDEAESGRRLADENLRILQGEIARQQPITVSESDALRGLRAELLAARQAAADAERRATASAERTARLEAERSLRTDGAG